MADPDEYDHESVYEAEPQPGPPVDPPDQPRTLYGSVVSRRDQPRPIVPAVLRNRQQRRTATRWALRYGGHTAVYHLTRTPKYAAKVALWAPVGAGRTIGRAVKWATAEEGNWALRQQAANRNDPGTWLQLDARRQRQASWRWPMLFAATLATTVAVLLLLSPLTPSWARWAALAAAVPILARLGRPADRPILDRVTPTATFRKLTAEMTRAALLATGYGREPADFRFPRDIQRDGAGWSALVDLPHGVTATMVMDRRERIAGALHLPIDQVWTRPGRHAGQIELWVADEPISQTRQPAWPLLRSGQADIFKPLPLGTNERGEPIAVLLMFTNLVIGAIPRMGKTFVLRLVLLAAALDPRVKVGAVDLKGTGDLGPLEPVATWYLVGDDDDEMDALMGALRELHTEMRRRTKVIRGLPRDLCPESKVTPELAAHTTLGLVPVVFGIDECQVLFTHRKHGDDAQAVCEDLIRRGPAVGIMLLLATQRPDAASLPTGISANAGMRFCLRVMGHAENDMVLGTGRHKQGIRATQFTAADKGLGWLVGALDDPTIVRAHYVDGPAAERVVARAVRLRGGPVDPDVREASKVAAYNLLDDVRAVWLLGEDALWTERIVPLLAQLRPDVYGQWGPDNLADALRAAGLSTTPINRRIEGEDKRTTRYGVRLRLLDAAIETDKTRRAITDS